MWLSVILFFPVVVLKEIHSPRFYFGFENLSNVGVHIIDIKNFCNF